MEPRLTADLGLKEGDLVWDVGGFEGGWSRDVFQHYGIKPLVFEPVPGYAKAIRDQGFDVVEAGLSGYAHEATITIAGDRSSTFEMGHEGSGKTRIRLLDVSEALGSAHLAVLKLNIEGGEYDVLPRLVGAHRMGQIRTLIVQFHTFVPDFGERYLAIKKALSETHACAWRDPFIWERWDKI